MENSTLYFTINLNNLVKKYPRLHNSFLSANYLKNNLKKIKSVCKKSGYEFKQIFAFCLKKILSN